MSIRDQDRHDKRRRVLEQLRARFGEERTDVPTDVYNLHWLTNFVRPLPATSADGQSADGSVERPIREALRAVRRRQRAKRRELGQEEARQAVAPATAAEDSRAAAEAMTLGAMIEEMPRMRENFAEWMGSVEADYLPSSSSLEELKLLHRKAEYRLKMLKVMVNQTQSQIDALTVAIRADETVGADQG